MKFAPISLLVLLFILVSAPEANAQTQTDTQHEGKMQRGDHVMGFSHHKTTHHFGLFKNGGEIAVTTNDPKDEATIGQIRMHLGHIAKMFAGGDFNAPILVHGTTPPGTATMTQLKDQIHYDFSDVDRGAEIRIVTDSPQAADAIHAFLLFQIIDHQTGDSPTIH